MIDSTWLMLLTIAGPVLLAAAIAYTIIKQRRLTPTDRSQLREISEQEYVDAEEDDGCPIRVNTEKRNPDAGAKARRGGYGALSGTTR